MPVRVKKNASKRTQEGGNAMRRLLIAVAALVLGLGDARSAEITRILVGFPPGQATDMVARLLADRLAPLLGESVIVENRPGQGGSIALGTLLQAAADGHTMVLAPLASMVVNPHMYKSISYDIFRDFAPVAQVADLPLLLVTNPSLPVKTLSELIAYAKANPGKLSNPSSGNGTLSHLGMELFKQRAGISIVHVPYRGSPQAMVDLMGGIVDVAMDTVPVTEPFIRAGKMRLIASAYGKRVPAFPDTPTIAEQGFPEVDLSAWLGIVVPAATPKERVDQLAAALNKITQSPDIVEKFAAMGAIPRALGPAEFGAFLKTEDARWSTVVKTSGVRIE
jgi:tripartite-type tricarboxylate transporter receptor subunit TctC